MLLGKVRSCLILPLNHYKSKGMNLQIRKAMPADSSEIATILLLAMEEIVYEFLGVRDKQAAFHFMEQMVSTENNQYSWQNAHVMHAEDKIAGAVIVYDGARLHELRKPVAEYIRAHTSLPFAPEDETQAGEFYLDSIGVHPEWQGKGIGGTLLQYLISEYVEKQGLKLGLLVEKANPAARRLYEKVGFRKTGEKTLVGKTMDHLQVFIAK